MKKLLLTLLMAILILPAFPVKAEVRYATVFNPDNGDRKAVEIGDPHAFDGGYLLETTYGYKEIEDDLLGFSVISSYRTTLSSSMTSSQATIPVSSVTTKDGHTITMGDLGSKVFFTVEPGANKEELIMCTSLSSTTWGSCTRGLAFFGTSTTAVSANRKTHSAGSVVVMSNVHYVYDELVDKDSDETIAGVKTYTSSPIVPSPTTGSQAANKSYVDNGLQQGGATSTESVVGIVQLGTQAEMAAGTFDANSPQVISTKYASSTRDVATTTVIVTDENGYLKQEKLNLTEDFAFSTTTQATSTITRANITNLQVGSTTITEYPTASSSAATVGVVKAIAGCSSSATSTDFFWVGDNTVISKSTDVFTKAKEYRVWCDGEITTVFEIQNDGGAVSAKGRIYVNDIATGIEFTSPATNVYATSTPENISVNRGDKVSVYIKETTAGAGNALIRNFDIYANRASDPALLLP